MDDDSPARPQLFNSFEENIKRCSYRYVVAFSWKHNIDISDKEIVEKHLSQSTDCLQETKKLLEAYDAAVRLYCLEDIADPVVEKEKEADLHTVRRSGGNILEHVIECTKAARFTCGLPHDS